MNYIDTLIKEKRKLNEEIRKCNDKDFERLVYKYNFYTLLEDTIENQMIEDTYGELLSSENIYEKLYKKFMDWIDAPNLIDDFVLVTFLQEIENENKINDKNIDITIINEIAEIFNSYYLNKSPMNEVKEEIINDILKNEIPYEVLRHLYFLYEDSLPRCEEDYINKIRDVLYKAEDYFFQKEYNRETIKYLIFKDEYIKTYKDYIKINDIVKLYNQTTDLEQRNKIIEKFKTLESRKDKDYTEFEKNNINYIYTDSATFELERINNKLMVTDKIDLFYINENLLIDYISPEKLKDINDDIKIFTEINKIEKDKNIKDIGEKIIELKKYFKIFGIEENNSQEEERQEI